MSINSARICCTGCDYETREVHRPIIIQYRTKNGDIIKTGRSKGWCYNCSDYSDIEKIDKGALREELASKEHEQLEATDRLAELNKGFLSAVRQRGEIRRLQQDIESLSQEIVKLRALLNIAVHRKSKARCLKCWSDNTTPIFFDAENNLSLAFQHECGGNLKIIRDQDGPRFSFRITTYVLNDEGELLGDA